MRSRRYVAYFRFPDFTLGMSVTQIAWELVFIVCLFPSDLEVRVCVKVRNMNRDCWFHWSQPFFFSFGRLRQCRICNSTKQKKKTRILHCDIWVLFTKYREAIWMYYLFSVSFLDSIYFICYLLLFCSLSVYISFIDYYIYSMIVFSVQ